MELYVSFFYKTHMIAGHDVPKKINLIQRHDLDRVSLHIYFFLYIAELSFARY